MSELMVPRRQKAEGSKFTGVTQVDPDRIQPYQVWWEGKIVWFARTIEEANEELKKYRLRAIGKGMRRRLRG